MKKEVVEHRPESKTVPHCELVAKWIKEDQKVKSLEHTVDILGTTEEDNYFTINIDPGDGKYSSLLLDRNDLWPYKMMRWLWALSYIIDSFFSSGGWPLASPGYLPLLLHLLNILL